MAAGRGVRMASDRPKVLHTVGGVPMIERVLRALAKADVGSAIVVVAPGSDEVRAALPAGTRCVEQPEPKGTGDAVRAALGSIDAAVDTVVVIGADTPLTSPDTLRAITRERGDAAIAL